MFHYFTYVVFCLAAYDRAQKLICFCFSISQFICLICSQLNGSFSLMFNSHPFQMTHFFFVLPLIGVSVFHYSEAFHASVIDCNNLINISGVELFPYIIFLRWKSWPLIFGLIFDFIVVPEVVSECVFFSLFFEMMI